MPGARTDASDSLLLRYRAGDYNCLHQDLYGEVAFPFQVVCFLSEPGRDYKGGEFLLVEQAPRAQAMGRALRLRQGDGLVITTRHRPVQGKRGYYKVNVRHGVSPVTEGSGGRWGSSFTTRSDCGEGSVRVGPGARVLVVAVHAGDGGD